jgi:hypothetical protein
MAKLKTGRSNRPLTQFAADHIEGFLLGKAINYEATKGNTTVRSRIGEQYQTFTVLLHGSPILELVAEDWDPLPLAVSIGQRFTFDGHPTSTTIERLNGLLDRLGELDVIPPGVRIFHNKDAGAYCLGKGDEYVAVGAQYARNVVLEPDPDRFQIRATDLERVLTSGGAGL